MKHNQYDIDEKIAQTNLANMFHVYPKNNINSNNNDSNNKLIYNLTRTFNFTGIDNIAPDVYFEHLVVESDTWTIIAHKYYDNNRLWWLICKLNNISDPTVQPIVGEKIKILRQEFINNILTGIRNS